MRRTEKNRKSRLGGRLIKRIALIVTLALAFVLADIFSPTLKNWFSGFLPHVDYYLTAEQLTHEMEKAGELVAIRHTDTGIMTGTVKALFLGNVSKVTAPYLYEIGLGIKLEDVKLTPEENCLTVTVPQPQMLYDSFQITGAPQNDDFFQPVSKAQYQQMQDEQQEACRGEYLKDGSYLQQAWEAVCEQLEALFRQWTGEKLQLRFLREGE